VGDPISLREVVFDDALPVLDGKPLDFTPTVVLGLMLAFG